MFNSWMLNSKLFNASVGQQPPVIIGGGDLGSKTAPFNVTYKVYDPSGEAVTVLEKLNGVVINTRPNVPQNTDLTLEVTQVLWDALTINANHSITIEATNESELSSTKHSTFYRQNNIPSTPEVTAPVAGATVSGLTTIAWTASTDPDAGQTLTYNVYYSLDEGLNKHQIAGDVAGLSLQWDTSDLTADAYQVFVQAYDGIDVSEYGASGSFTIKALPPMTNTLYVFDRSEYFSALLTKGEFNEAVHREVLNGENTFTFSFPANTENAQYVEEGCLIGFFDLDGYWQFFEVKRLVDVHGDGLTRTAYCEHILYELLDDIVTDKRPSSSAASALSGMLEGTRWQVGVVDNLGTANTSAYYEPALSAVQKVAGAWRGELQWRCVVAGGVITRYVDLLAMRGTDTGKQFAYAKDILTVEREVDSSGIVTALYGRGKGVETESGEGYGRRLTFADVVADDKPAGQEWVGDADALAQWGRNGRHRFDVFVDEDETDPAKLLEKTRAELAKRTTPRVTYSLDVVSLEQLSGYEHEAVRLGDLVRVIDREFRPELVVSARVVELERDLLAPEKTRVVLGRFAPTIVEATINTARRVEEMANRPHNTKWLDGVIDVLQNAIENSQAYIWETPQGTLHLNAPTYAEATEAMLLGGGRFAIANQKDGLGGWNWRTFGTGAGFTADEMNTGTLNAALVKILSAGGDLIIDGSGLMMYDDNDDLRVQIGSWLKGLIRKYGIKIVDGEIYSSIVRSGAEDATNYIQFKPPNRLEIVYDGALQMLMEAFFGGRIHFYHSGEAIGQISGYTSGADIMIAAMDTGKIQMFGQLLINGGLDVSGGTKNCVDPTENYGFRAMSAVEATEILFYDRGQINLVNGEATVHFDPIYLELIEPNMDNTPWHIWVECYGENGVYVSEVGENHFKVKERNGGTSSNKVIWRFEATRKGYADRRMMEVFF